MDDIIRIDPESGKKFTDEQLKMILDHKERMRSRRNGAAVFFTIIGIGLLLVSPLIIRLWSWGIGG